MPTTLLRRPLAPSALLAVLLALVPASRASSRDVVFVLTSDVHYDAFENEDRNERVRETLAALNNITNLAWPEALGASTIPKPRGVLVLGDVIDDGDRLLRGQHQSPYQYAGFLADFGLDGTDGLLKFPVFETWGNHDGPPVGAEKFGFSFQANLKKRNQARRDKGWLTGLSTNGLHYSWDWDDVHFVMLGIYPADRQNPLVPRYNPTWHDPQGALTFLKEDLAARVGASGRPVVLLSHCGFDTDWWHSNDWRAVYDAASPYRVILYAYGHSGTGLRPWAPDKASAPWQCINTGQTEKGFFVVRITEDRLRAAYRIKDWKTTRLAGGRTRIEWDGAWKWMHTLDQPLPKLKVAGAAAGTAPTALAGLSVPPSASATPAAGLSALIQVDASKPGPPLRPIWRFFGYDEPNYTYMPNGKKLLTVLGQLQPQPVFIRTHHLLTSGNGSPALKWGSTGIYNEDAQGNPIYNFAIVDLIFDTYLERGLKPFVQLGFMPEALSIHPQDYPQNPPPEAMIQAGAGFSYPPKDYAKWGELCHQWAKHCVGKHGRAEVEQWWWEVWNEPNIFYWKGTREEYFKLYDYAVEGVRRALPTARVGGPHTAGGPGGTFLRAFLEHCLRGTNHVTGRVGSPLDFVAFHAKGNPRYTNGHVRMGISSQLKNVDDGFATVAAFPELKNKPVVIGESDPEGCAACRGPQLGYRNGTMYSSYTAASFARKLELAERHGVNFEGALTWAFTFENQPLFAGFRQLATGGLDLPVLNVFRMFSKMDGRRLPARSTRDAGVENMISAGVRGTPDISGLASLGERRMAVLLWHYHDDDLPGPAAEVDLALSRLPFSERAAKVSHYRVDAENSNAYTVWRSMGSPASPSPKQYRQLEQASALALLPAPNEVRVRDAQARLQLSMPRQAVSLLVIEW